MTAAYIREHNTELHKLWRCPPCGNIARRHRNDDTPASPAGMRQQEVVPLEDTSMSYNMSDYDEHSMSHVLGHTDIATPISSHNTMATPQENSAQQNTSIGAADSITYDRFSQLIKTELQSMRENLVRSITNDIKSALIQEFNIKLTTLKSDMDANTNVLSEDQRQLKEQVINLDQTVKVLQTENTKLQKELESLKYNIENHRDIIDTKQQNSVVIYGLNEYAHENEQDLIERVNSIFYDILGIDINGFIEGVTRIGKRGYRRPVVIDLINKRMTKYILRNNTYFKNTGLGVSEFLDPEALKKRHILRNTIIDAKKKGLYPTVRNGKVFINGNEYLLPTNTEHNKPDSMDPNSSCSTSLRTEAATTITKKNQDNFRKY
jgi:cell division protein FtsB